MLSVRGIVVPILNFYGILIFAYVIMSWFVRPGSGGLLGDIYGVLRQLCEPYVGLFRRILPPVMIGSAGLDFSPLVALVVLQVVTGIATQILH